MRRTSQNWYLSVKYDRDETTGAVTAHQDLYIDKLLKKWGMTECKPLASPFPSKADKMIDDLAQPVDHVDPVMLKQYQALIGSFLYLQGQTMTELSWCISLLSRYMSKPGEAHMTAAKRVLR